MKETHKTLDHLFRKSHGKLISNLISKFGLKHFFLIENAVMDAYVKAMKIWPYKGIPDQPVAWLYTVSYRRILDELKKKDNQHLELDQVVTDLIETAENIDQADKELADPELRLLFTICNDNLKKEDQLAFMLKSISGFGNKEIANALLISEEGLKKRISRSRQFITSHQLKFEWPSKFEIPSRRTQVHKVLYLLFNEGFYSSKKGQVVRKELCIEAMRLTKFLSEHEYGNHDTYALMSIMCYHIARYDSRLDENKDLILLRNQDRTTWNPFFIEQGHRYLYLATHISDEQTNLQIEAAICNQHALAPSLEKTNWKNLELLYSKLYKNQENKMILLNLIIVQIMGGKIKEAKQSFESLDVNDFKNYKTHFYLVGVELYKQLEDEYQKKLWLSLAEKESPNLVNKKLHNN